MQRAFLRMVIVAWCLALLSPTWAWEDKGYQHRYWLVCHPDGSFSVHATSPVGRSGYIIIGGGPGFDRFIGHEDVWCADAWERHEERMEEFWQRQEEEGFFEDDFDE